jgi:hypothetical protein
MKPSPFTGDATERARRTWLQTFTSVAVGFGAQQAVGWFLPWWAQAITFATMSASESVLMSLRARGKGVPGTASTRPDIEYTEHAR